MRAVRAVRALTRFHYGGARRRRSLTREASRDRQVSASWGWHENIVGMGVSWKREKGRRHAGALCVTFYVLRKEPTRRLLRRERIPEYLDFASVDGRIVTDIAQVPGRFVAHAPRVRPIRPGAEVGHMRGGRGTVGPIVLQEGDATPLALSCSHVIARSGAIRDFGKEVEQPVGNDASDVVGSLVDFTVLRSGTLVTFDVALAALDVAAEPGVLGTTIVPRTVSTKDAKSFKEGTKTVLFGQVTRGARGEVEAFQSTWDIAEVPFVDGLVQFSGLVAYKTKSAKGDSGALVMSGEPGEEAHVLGLHTAGRSDGAMGLFQPIGPILSKFHLQLFTP
jgi:hypothetical protein